MDTNVSNLFLLCFFLFLLALLLQKLSFPFLVDSILALFFFISGVIAVLSESYHEKQTGIVEGLPITAIVEIVAFSDQIRIDRVRVEGRLLYLADQQEFKSFGKRVLVDLKGKTRIPSPGDFIVANGTFELPDRRKNPGGVSRVELFRQQGWIGSFRSVTGGWTYLRNRMDNGLGVSFSTKLRGKVGVLIEDVFPDDDAGFLKGILLGARSQIPKERKNDFSKAGIFHVLAISGLHIGIISGILFILLSILRLPPFLRVLAVTPVLLIYGSVTGLKPAIRRAIVMMTSIMLAFSFQRKIDLVNLLYLIALVFIVLSPSTMWNPGFQMSFLATWGILALYPGMNKVLQSFSLSRIPVIRTVPQIFLVSVCAQIPLVPVIASSFHMISLVSPVTNIIALPVVALLLPAGLLSLSAQMFFPILTVPFSEVTSLLIDILYGASRVMSNIPLSSIKVSPLDLPGVLTYYTVIYLASLILEGKVKWEVIVVVLLLSSTARIVIGICSGDPPLRVTFLDIGQGDSAVVEFPSGGSMLVDGGPARLNWNSGEGIIEPFLLDRGIDDIDIIAFSHPQLDHIGGLPFLLERYKVDAIIEPGHPTYLNEYIRMLELSLQNKVQVYLPRRGDCFVTEGVEIRVLHPTEKWIGSNPSQDEVNDASLVLKITNGNVSFLLTGDIGPEVEEELVHDVGTDLQVNILKVAHHGSHISSTSSFLDEVCPSIAVVSVGRGNPFGHPSPNIIESMKERGITVLRTDIHGAIIFVVREDRFDVYDGSDELLLSSEDITIRQ
jgi:competence protein ComEC